ncbi:MAG: hypothetical protein R3C44_07885 [Chloroflexota bacterium]
MTSAAALVTHPTRPIWTWLFICTAHAKVHELVEDPSRALENIVMTFSDAGILPS